MYKFDCFNFIICEPNFINNFLSPICVTKFSKAIFILGAWTIIHQKYSARKLRAKCACAINLTNIMNQVFVTMFPKPLGFLGSPRKTFKNQRFPRFLPKANKNQLFLTIYAVKFLGFLKILMFYSNFWHPKIGSSGSILGPRRLRGPTCANPSLRPSAFSRQHSACSLQPAAFACDKWQVTRDEWQVADHNWQVTSHTFQVTSTSRKHESRSRVTSTSHEHRSRATRCEVGGNGGSP